MQAKLASIFLNQDISLIISADFSAKDFASLSRSCRFFRQSFKAKYIARIEQLLLDIDAIEEMSVAKIGKCIDFVKAHNPDKAFVLLNSILDEEVKYCLNPFSRPRSIRVPALEDFLEESPALPQDETIQNEKDTPRVFQLEEMLIKKFGIAGFFGERTVALLGEARTILYLATLQAVLTKNLKDQSVRLINYYFNWIANKNFGQNPERYLELKNGVTYSRFLNKSIENLIAEFTHTQSQKQNVEVLTKLMNLYFRSKKSDFSEAGCVTIDDPITIPAGSNPIYVLIDQWLEYKYKYKKNVDSLNETTIRLFKKFAADFFSYLRSECELLRKADLLFPKKDILYFKDDKLCILDFEIQDIIDKHVEEKFEDSEDTSKDLIVAELTAAVEQEIAKLNSHTDNQNSRLTPNK